MVHRNKKTKKQECMNQKDKYQPDKLAIKRANNIS